MHRGKGVSCARNLARLAKSLRAAMPQTMASTPPLMQPLGSCETQSWYYPNKRQLADRMFSFGKLARSQEITFFRSSEGQASSIRTQEYSANDLHAITPSVPRTESTS